jgi:hypothetical protein
MSRAAHCLVAIAALAMGCASSRTAAAPEAAPAAEPVAVTVSRADLPAERPRNPDTGRVRLRSELPDAEVLVNGVTQGVAGDFFAPGYLELEPGLHRIEVRKEGYASFRAEVVVAAEVLETIPVTLRRLPTVDPDSGEPDGDEGYEEGDS